MISIKRALMDDRALRATIGLSASEFNLNRSNACRNVQKLTPILEKVLGKKMALPNMEINSLEGTIDFSSEITIPPNFTAECAENAETLEKPSGVWNTLKLRALCDLRVDKSLVFSIVPFRPASRGSNK